MLAGLLRAYLSAFAGSLGFAGTTWSGLLRNWGQSRFNSSTAAACASNMAKASRRLVRICRRIQERAARTS